MNKVNYDEIETEFRQFLFGVLKDSTKNMLDFLDGMKKNDSITKAEDIRLDHVKQFAKGKFMELQGELLGGLKCLMETGTIPRGVDHRVRPED